MNRLPTLALAAALPMMATAARAEPAKTPATAPASTQGRQAVECFALYKMAADAPQYAKQRPDLVKMQNLMTWSMGRYAVTQAQATRWADEFNLGARGREATAQAFERKITSCNGFARNEFDAYMRSRSAGTGTAPAR